MFQPKINVKCAGCDAFVNKMKGKKKTIKNATVVDSLFIKKTVKNVSNFDEENASPSVSESTNNDPTFEIKFKSNDEIPDVERIHLPIQRTVATHKYCCLCFSTMNLTTIPEEARAQSYIKKKIYIPQGNRYCRAHIIKNRIFDEDLGLLKVHPNT